jgi:predicted secreted hydrolase
MIVLRLIALFLICSLAVNAREYKQALPGYVLKFPADHRSHNEYKTEWWYYTGHLTANDGSRYGYELTFFRSSMDVPRPPKESVWSVDNIYLAHFALTDIGGKKFFHTSRLNRPGIDFAGADQKKLHVWNGDWKVTEVSDGKQKLIAKTPEYSLELDLVSEKPPALHGVRGLSQKASCVGCASYYYSLTRMKVNGTLRKNGAPPLTVSGLTWMDHEFGSNQLTPEQVGWDWFSLQLDDNTELMLYLMRRKDGKFDVNSSGTYVAADGSTRHLRLQDYTVTATGSWKSPHSNATYPMGWKVSIPALKAELEIIPELEDQELAKRNDTDVTYWEVASTVRGNINGKAITGRAYVEMTGYAEVFNKRI